MQLPSSYSHQGLNVADWKKLNSGKQIELDSIPELIKDKIIEQKEKGKK